EIIRIDRGGKRRLAYVMRKQRYGYYTLIHFRATPEPLPELERLYRLSERVLRYLTVRFEKEEHLTGFTRVPDEDGREEDREERRRGRRGESFQGRGEGRYSRRGSMDAGRFDGHPRRYDTAVTVTEDEAMDEDNDYPSQGTCERGLRHGEPQQSDFTRQSDPRPRIALCAQWHPSGQIWPGREHVTC